MQRVAKAQLKARLLEHVRRVERDQQPVLVTHAGRPVAKIVPSTDDPDALLRSLPNSVLVYREPAAPGAEAWEACQADEGEAGGGP